MYKNKKEIKKAICSAAVLVTSLLLTSCSPSNEKRTEITLLHGWGTMEPDHVIMRQIYEDFEKENPDVHLNLLSMPSSNEAIKKANDMMSVGEIPDIVFTGGTGRDSLYRFMTEHGYAVDYMPYIQKDQEFAQDISPVIRNYWGTEDGRLYTISDVLLYGGGYWYNERIFGQAGIDKVPGDWKELKEAFTRIKEWSDEGGYNVVPIQLNGENNLYLADLLMLEAGKESAEAVISNQISIDQQQFGKVLDELTWINSFSPVPYDYGYRDVQKQFNDGKSAVYLNGIWAGTMIDGDIQVKYAPLPSSDGTQVSSISSCLGYIVGSTGNEAKIDAAIRFVKYMVSDSVQNRILKETGQMPSNPNVDTSAYKDTLPRFQQASEAVKNADLHIEVPDNIWDNDRITFFKNKIMDVLNGSYSRQTFMDMLR